MSVNGLVNTKNHFKKCPWAKTYRNIAARTNTNGLYGKSGVRNLLKTSDLKDLWFRDNASQMKKPSIDRIDSDCDYTKENCRYIEHKENLKRPRGRRAFNKDYGVTKYGNKWRVAFRCNMKMYFGKIFKNYADAVISAKKFREELLSKGIASK